MEISNAFLDKVKKAIPEYEFTHGDFLGEGSRGSAYVWNDKVVLKITDDLSEALASNLILKKKLKHVNEIYDVFHVKGTGRQRIYLIFQKRLYSVEKSISEMIDRFLEYIDGETSFELNLMEEINNTLDIASIIESFCEKWLRERADYTSKKNILKKIFKMVVGSKKELMRYGVDFIDYHTGNILMDGKDFKLIDIGNSEVFKMGDDIKTKILEYYRKKFEGI